MTAARAFAPATVANLGPGLDVLALALEGRGDEVRAETSRDAGIQLAVEGPEEIPRDPSRNAASIAAREVLGLAGGMDAGLALRLRKGLPLAAGQGGSAASAAAGAVAADAAIGAGLSRRDLLSACLAAEEAVAGRHADNAAAALWGGVVLVRAIDPCDVVSLPFPDRLRVVLVEPDQKLPTRQARAVLPPLVPRDAAVFQAAQVGALVAALASGDLALLARAIQDRIAEPVRGPLLPGFGEVRQAALAQGACGCSISGAGPSVFAFADGDEAGRRIAAAMVEAYRLRGLGADARVCRIDRQGARVLAEAGDS